MPRSLSLSRSSRTRGIFRALVLTVVSAVVAALLVSVTTTPAVSATDPCGTSGNKISCENSKPGSPRSEWDVEDAGSDTIQGFSTNISANVGGSMSFKIDTNARAYTIGIYRMGWYGGDGARKIGTVTPSATLPQIQPQCITDSTTELYDCGNWGVSATWNIPSTAVSGVYEALLTRTDTGAESAITFVVRDDSSHSTVVFQTSDPTWQAYNTYGGADFYQGAVNGRAYKISYNRPVLTRDGVGGRDFFYSNEYPAVEFMERNGYDVSYISGVDTDRYGSLLLNHKTFMSVGHDEYWSKGQRANVEAARDAGVNLMFLSGNEVYWKTRYEPSADASHTDYRTLVSYKETWSNAKIDPSVEWTGTYRDPRFAPKSAGGGTPENGLTGTMYMAQGNDFPIQVTAAQGKNRLWRGTSVSSLSSGTKATLAPHTVGYESDEDVDNGSRPAGLIDLTSTTAAAPQVVTDYFGNDVAQGNTTHSMTMYRAPSGALVFGAGTIQWTWGLDPNHDSPFDPEPADVRMQQAQVNLFADMGAQPTTLQAGLTLATKSTDTVGPTVTITSPAAGAARVNGAQVTVSGTAADTGGGVVAGVEVSTDGATWHPATGTTSWTYSYTQHGVGATPIRVRATDDSANIGTTATVSTNVSCPCTVFGNAAPTNGSPADPDAVELGMRFTPTTDGVVTGVRFYKGAGNTGTHVGSLWNTSGQKLATVTFGNETATGWQQATFSAPVPVVSGTPYVVSYTAPAGQYTYQLNAFYIQGVNAAPLSVDGGFGATPAGVYGNPSTFPNSSYMASNYFVDPLFSTSDTSPLTAANQWPLPSSSSVPASTTISAQYSKTLVPGSQGVTLKDSNGVTVTGTTAYDTSTRTVTFTPSAPLNGFVNYTATLSGTDAQGNTVSTGKSWSFVTARPSNAPGVCPCSIFDDNTVPTLLTDTEAVPVTLGVRFTADVDGTITGVRFYKGVANTGTHTGALWTADGTQLATGTFTNESTTGWQDLTFSTPVAITKNTTYVASYRTAVGHYAASPNAFSNADLSKAPLHVTSNAGAYAYTDGFPDSTSSTSYLVDVVFQKATPSIAVASQDPANGSVSVPRGTSVTTTFTAPVSPGYTETVTQGTGNTAVPGTSSLSTDGTTLTFTPSALLAADSDVKVVLSGVTSTTGAALPTQTWTFHTKAADTATNQTLFSDQTPATNATTDGSAVELGAAFTPAADGQVTAIRFYKGTGNLGTHTGSLWSSTGTRLATVTFGAETSSGWQQATLSSPVAVTAGTTYVVSYFAPQGHYSYSGAFFNNPWTSGDLTAPSGNNGRYLYGSGGGFPVYSYNSTNYFVDVVFQRGGTTTTPTIGVVSQTPSSGATSVSRTSPASVTFTSPIASGYTVAVKNGTTTIAGTTALSADAKTLTFTPSATMPADSTITVTVTNVTGTNGATLASTAWSFRTAVDPSAPASLFSTLTPASSSIADSNAVNVGAAFTPSVAGKVTAIKFYKGAGNTGTHTGAIWSSSGTKLASVTFTGETTSGWQTATLATPLTLTAGQSYVVSYFAPLGHYAATGAFFTSPWTAGSLTAPSASNGRYLYSSASAYPTNSYNSTNYFVDVVFTAS